MLDIALKLLADKQMASKCELVDCSQRSYQVIHGSESEDGEDHPSQVTA